MSLQIRHLQKTFIVCLLVALGYIVSYAQGASDITLTIKSKSTAQILDTLDQLTSHAIYYKADDLSPVEKSYQWENVEITTIFKDILEGTNLAAVPYRGAAYIIMPNTSVDRSLLAEYMNNLNDISQTEKKANTQKITIGDIENLKKYGKAVLSGRVVDGKNNEPVISAQVSLGDQDALTDYDGRYTIEIRPGEYPLEISYVGYNTYKRDLDIKSDGTLDVTIDQEAVNLSEITVSAVGKGQAARETQSGVTRLDVKALEKLPTFLGEKDIVKAVLYNPGISNIGEGASGYNVRGGNVDQNLMLMDEAILFNAFHSLGFFSTFNTELIREATLSKSVLPAHLGGRLASALEVNMTEGNREKIRVKTSFNPASATMTLDGPLSKNVTLTLGGRATYTDYIFKLFSDVDLRQSRLGFYDLTGKLTYRSKGTTYSIAGYHSKDNFRFSNEFGFDYSSSFLQGSMQKLITPKTLMKIAIVGNKYSSNQQDLTPQLGTNQFFAIDHVKGIVKFLNEGKKNKLEYGISSIVYQVSPGEVTQLSNSFANETFVAKENAIESAIFGNYERKWNKFFETALGLRLNHYSAFGDKKSLVYQDGVIGRFNVVDTAQLSGMYGQSINFEPRISIKVNLSKTFVLKGGLARMHQYINQIYNTDTPAPNSQWQLSNEHIKPTRSDNATVGLYKSFKNADWEIGADVYLRRMFNVIDYIDFARLIANPHIEGQLAIGKGESKGLELSVKKNIGKLNGWATYTLSQTIQQIDGINNGQWYSSPFDKPHNFNFILNYQPIERRTLTASFNYSTGRPTTPPVGYALTPDNVYVPIYSERNQLRIPDYHRLDLSLNIARSHNLKAKRAVSWTFLLYNVYARQNPFSFFYLRGQDNLPRVRQLSVVGTMIPAIRLNIEFL